MLPHNVVLNAKISAEDSLKYFNVFGGVFFVVCLLFFVCFVVVFLCFFFFFCFCFFFYRNLVLQFY